MTTNDITTNGSNANLTLDPQGSGTIELAAATNITGNVDVTGTLTTDDITTAGTQTITGTLIVDGVTIKDNKITTNASNAVLEIAANSSGTIDVQNAMTTIGQTITGTVSVTGQHNIDNLRLDGNAITSTNTNGGITITPDGTGNITLGGNYVAVTNELSATDVAVGSEVLLGTGAKILQITTNEDLVLETNGTGTLRLNNPQTQATVGSAGSAASLPGQPTGYIKINLGGTVRVIPFYDQS